MGEATTYGERTTLVSGMRKESLNTVEFCLWGRCGGVVDIVRGKRTKANGDKSDIEERN